MRVGGTKRCSKCGDDLPLAQFHKDKSKRSGLRPSCRMCDAGPQRRWRNGNPHKQLANLRRWVAANPDKVLANRQRFAKAHPEKLRAYTRAYAKATREKVHAATAKWAKANPELKRAARRRSHHKLHADPAYRLKQRTRHAVIRAIRTRCGTKHRPTFDVLPYNPQQLVAHLTSTLPEGVTLDTALAAGYHIDHIVPVSAFNFTTTADTDFLRAFALANMRLIPAMENIRKNDKLLEHFQPSLGI